MRGHRVARACLWACVFACASSIGPRRRPSASRRPTVALAAPDGAAAAGGAAAPGGAAALAPVGCGFRKPMQSRGRVALYRKAEFWAAVESEMDLSALPRIAAMLARTRAGLADEVQPLSPRRGWKAHDRIFGRVVAPMHGVAPGHIVEVRLPETRRPSARQ
jgi:hypothetical protein